jgi:hypothetical protein
MPSDEKVLDFGFGGIYNDEAVRGVKMFLQTLRTGVVEGRASRDAACHAGGSGFDSRSRPDLRLVWKSCSFL